MPLNEELYMQNEISNSIDNVIRSLYQLVIMIEETTFACRVIDRNDEFSHFNADSIKNYSELYDTVYKNIHPEDRAEFIPFGDIEYLNRVLSERLFVYFDCRIRHSDSCYYWSKIVICNAKESESVNGEEYLFLIQALNDQEEETRKKEELKRELFELQSKYDRLFEENMTDAQTGCLNRKGLNYYEGIVLNKAIEENKSLLVCVLDLNGLKHLNDTYGHSAGDVAIKTVSDALKSAAPADSKIIRTGGDEFLLIAPIDDDFDYISDMERKMQSCLDTYNEGSSNPFEVSASYGSVKVRAEAVREFDALIEEADKKMYRMKEATDPYRR